MLSTQDEQAIQRMLGQAQAPEPLAKEAELCLRMYHRAGGSGPLGPMALMQLARRMKYTIAPERSPVERGEHKAAAWRSLPQDGSVMVEAHFFGDWQPGRFQGFCTGGTLLVKMDFSGDVKECRPHMTRYVGIAPPPPEARPPKAALLEEDDIPDHDAMAEAEMLMAGGHGGEGEVGVEVPEDDIILPIPDGAAVCVEEGEEVLDGVLVTTVHGIRSVKIDGEDQAREFVATAVMPQDLDLIAKQPAEPDKETVDGHGRDADGPE